jgi:ethanolamine transporter EutH
MKFNVGDNIMVTEFGKGFEKAIVIGVIEQNGRQYYKLSIVNGTATIPISAEVNYKIVNEKK